LHALALNQLGKRPAARALLESHGLNSRQSAAKAFPGGSKRLPWLIQQLDSIVGREVRLPGRRPAARRYSRSLSQRNRIADGIPS
jgi:hypothetical protein